MSADLPGEHGELVTPTSRPTPYWYRWFKRVHTRLLATETTATAAAAAVAAIPAAHAPNITGLAPIQVYGSAATDWQIGTSASSSSGGTTIIQWGEDSDNDFWPIPFSPPAVALVINEQTVTSAATVTPTFLNDSVVITAQAAALALANPSGSGQNGWGISIRIKDNGTARAITYGTQYRAIGVTLPTTTVISKTVYLGIVFNSADTKWDVVAVAQEA